MAAVAYQDADQQLTYKQWPYKHGFRLVVYIQGWILTGVNVVEVTFEPCPRACFK